MIKDLPEGETHFDPQAEFIEKKCAEFEDTNYTTGEKPNQNTEWLRKVLAEAESMAREDEADRCEIHTQTALQKQRKELVEEVVKRMKIHYYIQLGEYEANSMIIKDDLLALLEDYKLEK